MSAASSTAESAIGCATASAAVHSSPQQPGGSKSGSSQASSSPGVINVFRIPHSRMKELVELHLRQVVKIKDFSSNLSEDIDMILQAVYQAMWELKSHEYIENHYIMDRLKARLQARRVYNQLVCNCHEDSKLLGVIRLVEKVYSANNEAEREGFGRELQSAIQDFLKEFLHHMEEEEEIFQPLLNENFEAKELADMNEVVLKQHSLFRQKVQTEKSLTAIKRKREDDVFDEFEFSVQDLRFRKSYCQEVEDFCMVATKKGVTSIDEARPPPPKQPKAKRSKVVAPAKPRSVVFAPRSICDLPEELVAAIFSYLPPRALLRAAQVCKSWNLQAFQGNLWRALFPSLWARGDWRFPARAKDGHKGDVILTDPGQLEGTSADLGSSTESLCSEVQKESSIAAPYSIGASSRSTSRAENRILEGLISSLLPKVGEKVTDLIFTHSRAVTDAQLASILALCPNLVRLNLAYSASVSDGAFRACPDLRKLEVLNLEGCTRVNDALLKNLRSGFVSRGEAGSKVRRINLSGCPRVTSYGVAMLEVHQGELEELDLSGCYKLDGQTLTQLVRGCARLKPERLSYCNDIEDGPYRSEANGCSNLECELRFCCQQLKN